MRYIVLILLSITTLSEPWFNLSDSNHLNEINNKLKACKFNNLDIISYPVSLGEINFLLEKINDKNHENILCKEIVDKIKISLKERFIQSKKTVFGIQTGSNNQYFQTKGNRYYIDDNYYFSISDINSSFAYKFKIRKTTQNNKNYFDESYISYKYKNHIYTTGRINRWWSPSDSYSLIMSNSARPSLGIEFKNYLPIQPKQNLLKHLGYVNYEFFVNKLEKEREIPNTLLFGNRVTFNPSENLKISLLRLAQFGGKDRPKNASTIFNMLIGKDNTSSNLSFDDQPGNQLAGFDFIFTPKKNKNLKIYSQLIGEDEAGYFPSRKLSLFGFSYRFDDKNLTKLNIDYIDTYSGVKNYSYNHSLYKSGLRYYGMPIAASIDADSEAVKLTLNKKYNNLGFEFSFSDISLNKNNSRLNFWTREFAEFHQYNLFIKYNYKKSYIDMIYTYSDQKFNNYSKNNFFINMYIKF